jgi:hypothetical protein
MNVSSYRSGTHAIAERIEDARAESTRLFAIPAVHRAMLPPPILAELSAVKHAIDADLARGPDIHALTRLEDALEALRALRVRVDEVVARTRRCPRAIPPPPPRPWSFALRIPIRIEDAFRAQLPHAKISKDHAGMLAKVEHAGTTLHFLARAYAKSWSQRNSSDHWVECWLGAGAPLGPRMELRTRTEYKRTLDRSGNVVPAYCAFDEAFEMRGDPHLVAELLDRDACEALSWMAVYEPTLTVGDGAIELAWIDRYNPVRPMLQGAMLHLVSTIASRF